MGKRLTFLSLLTQGRQYALTALCVFPKIHPAAPMAKVCGSMDIGTKSNRVDIGVRAGLPAEVFSHLADGLYERKTVYRTEKYGDLFRTFCMNPKGAGVSENTNGIAAVNGHSYPIRRMTFETVLFPGKIAPHKQEKTGWRKRSSLSFLSKCLEAFPRRQRSTPPR